MGTKVHYRSYFPLHDTMRDLNADTGHSWSSFYINKTLRENFFNDYLLSSLNGYSEYDKEILKRTMLEHEAIFRKQVYELHRLYSIQKDLMAEFQKNSPLWSSKYGDSSKMISCTSQVQSEYATKLLQISHLQAMHDSQKKEQFRCKDDIISTINFFERNRLSSSSLCETEALQIESEPDANFRKCPKTMLHLQLPDYGYINDTEILKEEFHGSSSLNRMISSRIFDGDSDIELKLNLVNGSGPTGKGDVCKLNYHHNKRHFTSLVCSDEPNKHALFKGASNSFSLQVSVPRTQKEENHGLSFSLSSTRLSLQKSFPKGIDCCERDFSNDFEEKTSRGTVCYNETGKLCPVSFTSSISYREKNSLFYEPTKLNVNKAGGIVSTDRNEGSTQFVHEKGNYFQFRNLDSGKLPSALPISLSSSPNFESDGISSPLIQNWMELSSDENDTWPLSAIPSFKGTNNVKTFCSSDIHNAATGSLQVGSDLNSSRGFKDNSLSHLLNGLNDEFPCQSHSTSQLKFHFSNVNPNEEAEIRFSGTRNPLTAQQNKAVSGIGGKCEGPTSLPSLVDLGLSKINQVYERKTENLTSLSSCNLDVFSSMHKRESEIKSHQLSDSLSTAKSTNFEQNLASSLNEKKLVMDELRHFSMMPDDIKMYSSKKSTSAEINIRNSRNYIDLNSAFPVKDDLDSSDSSTKVQTDIGSNCSEQVSFPWDVTLFDLEAPVNNISSMRLQEESCSHEMLTKEAADNIVKLSSDGFKEKEDVHYLQSMSPSKNALHLFAEMVLSEENIIISNEHLEDGFDLFELMNLQLEEMKPEKLWCRPREVENIEEDKRSKVSILLAKPRRAQGRKRRQRKDFQKDILPALTTLSRQETIKDLQAIGELMKAAGMPWQVGTRSRKARRNFAQPRASRKRRQIKAPASVAMVHISPTALFKADGHNDNPEIEVDRNDIVGWGRKTRRCRSKRCHPISISTTLT